MSHSYFSVILYCIRLVWDIWPRLWSAWKCSIESFGSWVISVWCRLCTVLNKLPMTKAPIPFFFFFSLFFPASHVLQVNIFHRCIGVCCFMKCSCVIGSGKKKCSVWFFFSILFFCTQTHHHTHTVDVAYQLSCSFYLISTLSFLCKPPTISIWLIASIACSARRPFTWVYSIFLFPHIQEFGKPNWFKFDTPLGHIRYALLLLFTFLISDSNPFFRVGAMLSQN